MHLAGGGEGVADFVGFGVLHGGDAREELAAVAVEDVFDERFLWPRENHGKTANQGIPDYSRNPPTGLP